MSRKNRNRLLVPEAREGLNQLKSEVLQREGLISSSTKVSEIPYEVAKDMSVPFHQDYNGDITTKDAGKIGGQIGGRMVRELVRRAQEQLVRKSKL